MMYLSHIFVKCSWETSFGLGRSHMLSSPHTHKQSRLLFIITDIKKLQCAFPGKFIEPFLLLLFLFPDVQELHFKNIHSTFWPRAECKEYRGGCELTIRNCKMIFFYFAKVFFIDKVNKNCALIYCSGNAFQSLIDTRVNHPGFTVISTA